MIGKRHFNNQINLSRLLVILGWTPGTRGGGVMSVLLVIINLLVKFMTQMFCHSKCLNHLYLKIS